MLNQVQHDVQLLKRHPELVSGSGKIERSDRNLHFI